MEPLFDVSHGNTIGLRTRRRRTQKTVTTTWCLLAAVATAALLSHGTPTCGADDLDDISAFVQAVLATADRDELGLPESPVSQRHRPVVDGQLPADLQEYLERLVSVSRAPDGPLLVDMLSDDAIVVDNDQDPHDVFDRYRGRGDGKRDAAGIRGGRSRRSVDEGYGQMGLVSGTY